MTVHGLLSVTTYAQGYQIIRHVISLVPINVVDV
jgi:hypothetical protein